MRVGTARGQAGRGAADRHGVAPRARGGQRHRDARGARRARGRGPGRSASSAPCALGAEMLVLGGVAAGERGGARARSRAAIASGAAARGGRADDRGAGRRPARRRGPRAARGGAGGGRGRGAARAASSTRVDALDIGLAAVAMGAGRTRADQAVDPAVGITVLAKPGARVCERTAARPRPRAQQGPGRQRASRPGWQARLPSVMPVPLRGPCCSAASTRTPARPAP